MGRSFFYAVRPTSRGGGRGAGMVMLHIPPHPICSSLPMAADGAHCYTLAIRQTVPPDPTHFFGGFDHMVGGCVPSAEGMRTMEDRYTVVHREGRLRGAETAPGVLLFAGIPFARAPRWQPPSPLPLPQGTVTAHQWGPAPYQPPPDPFFAQRSGEPMEVPMDEECLNLNIWTADLTTPKKAVLFWVYGGSFIQGYNYKRSYDPRQLVAAHPELLVVAPNYRVGVLGSLDLSVLGAGAEYRYSNNLALLDLMSALAWVKEHIALFSGDPDNVTLYGHSAGSNAISHLLASPMAGGLFHKAICQSSFLCDQGTVARDTARDIGASFFRLLGASTMDAALSASPQQLLDAQKQLFPLSFVGRPSKLFSPVEDGLVVHEDAFARLVRGEINAQALMVGSSEGEYDQMFRDKDAQETLEQVLQRDRDKSVTRQDLARFRQMHPEWTEKECYMSVHNQLGLVLAGELLARACSPHIPVYQYLFRLRDPELGWRALHGAPCTYVFGVDVPASAPPELAPEMMERWAAFLCTGAPRSSHRTHWPRYRPDGPVMIFDGCGQTAQAHWRQDFAFWQDRFRESALLSAAAPV